MSTVEEQLNQVGLVNIKKHIADLVVYLPYATSENFVNHPVYPNHEAYIHEDLINPIQTAVNKLLQQGFQLKVLDAYRPFSVQEEFWGLCPDDRYLAKPVRSKGKMIQGSNHNRGVALDCTLVDKVSQRELLMPSDFDEFNQKAHRNWSDLSSTAVQNAMTLEKVLLDVGFSGNPNEWWHFDFDCKKTYPLLDIPLV